MRRIILPILLCLGLTVSALAQQPKDVMKDPIPVAMFQATYAFHIPGLDTKKLYGISHNIGGSFVYKTESNWLFTANGNYIYGTKLNIDRVQIFGEGITTDVGEIIGSAGSFTTLEINQRGLFFQGEVGKMFPLTLTVASSFRRAWAIFAAASVWIIP